MFSFFKKSLIPPPKNLTMQSNSRIFSRVTAILTTPAGSSDQSATRGTDLFEEATAVVRRSKKSRRFFDIDSNPALSPVWASRLLKAGILYDVNEHRITDGGAGGWDELLRHSVIHLQGRERPPPLQPKDSQRSIREWDDMIDSALRGEGNLRLGISLILKRMNDTLKTDSPSKFSWALQLIKVDSPNAFRNLKTMHGLMVKSQSVHGNGAFGLIQAYSRVADLISAKQVYKEREDDIRAKQGYLYMCSNHNQFQEGERIFHELLSMGKQNHSDYSSMLIIYGNLERVEEASSVFQHYNAWTKDPCPHVINSMVWALGKVGQIDRAYGVAMGTRGGMTIEMCNSIVWSCCQFNSGRSIAEKVFWYAQNLKQVSDYEKAATAKLLHNLLSNLGDYQGAEAIEKYFKGKRSPGRTLLGST